MIKRFRIPELWHITSLENSIFIGDFDGGSIGECKIFFIAAMSHGKIFKLDASSLTQWHRLIGNLNQDSIFCREIMQPSMDERDELI